MGLKDPAALRHRVGHGRLPAWRLSRLVGAVGVGAMGLGNKGVTAMGLGKGAHRIKHRTLAEGGRSKRNGKMHSRRVTADRQKTWSERMDSSQQAAEKRLESDGN
jgi:hypothetical protein